MVSYVELLHSFPVGEDRGSLGACVSLSLSESCEKALLSQDLEKGLPPSPGGAGPKAASAEAPRPLEPSENEDNPALSENGETRSVVGVGLPGAPDGGARVGRFPDSDPIGGAVSGAGSPILSSGTRCRSLLLARTPHQAAIGTLAGPG